MDGINKADSDYALEKTHRTLSESIDTSQVPCVFISYQRKDEDYASEIADYIKSKEIDVYFDLDDSDLKLQRQLNNSSRVTSSIQKGLSESDYMIVIVSPTTYKSPWVPFEIGYAYDDMGHDMKILRHKGIDKRTFPQYLQVREVLNGRLALFSFINSIRSSHRIYESLKKGGKTKFSVLMLLVGWTVIWITNEL
jgi:hypothetical protein